MMSLILIMTKMLLLDIFSFSAGSDSGEQQLMVNSFLWNPFLSGIFTWKITPEQSHQHCQKEQDHLSYYNILFRCWELHNDDSVWVSRVENHMSCRRCLWPLPGGTSPTASCLSIPHSVLKGGGSEKCFFLRQPKVCFGQLGQVIGCSTLGSTFEWRGTKLWPKNGHFWPYLAIFGHRRA